MCAVCSNGNVGIVDPIFDENIGKSFISTQRVRLPLDQIVPTARVWSDSHIYQSALFKEKKTVSLDNARGGEYVTFTSNLKTSSNGPFISNWYVAKVPFFFQNNIGTVCSNGNAEIFDPIFDETTDKILMMKKLDQIEYEAKQDLQVFTVISVLEISLKSIFAGVSVTEEEANYSNYVIWPLLDTVVRIVEGLMFSCGEYRLRSVDKECARRNINSNEHYKADGCISTLIDGLRIDLVLLEVSGPFNLDDESRFTKGHIKAGYGLIAMLNDIAYTYNYASFDVLTSVRIFFLHAKKNKLRFWSFEMPSHGLYVLNLLNSVVIPDDCASCELPIEILCTEIWNLRTMLHQTRNAIWNLRESHILNQRAFNRSMRKSPDLVPTLLTDSLRIDNNVKLDVNYIPAYDELVINSSLF